MLASEYIGAMADMLEKEGWIQGEMSSREGRCLVGAFSSVRTRCINFLLPPDIPEHYVTLPTARYKAGLMVEPMVNKVIDYISAELRRAGAMEWEQRAFWGVWNDDPKRTKQEVLDLLRKAEKKARYDEDYVDYGKQIADRLAEG